VPGTATTSTTGPQTTNYYQGSPLAQTLGVASTVASGFGSSPARNAKGEVMFDPAGNMIMQANGLQSLLDKTGISGLVSSGYNSISDYLKGFGDGPDVSDPSSTGQTGLPSNYTPPYDYYTSPEYYQSQYDNSLLDSSSAENLDFIP
jgi:hypothetical protein